MRQSCLASVEVIIITVMSFICVGRLAFMRATGLQKSFRMMNSIKGELNIVYPPKCIWIWQHWLTALSSDAIVSINHRTVSKLTSSDPPLLREGCPKVTGQPWMPKANDKKTAFFRIMSKYHDRSFVPTKTKWRRDRDTEPIELKIHSFESPKTVHVTIWHIKNKIKEAF